MKNRIHILLAFMIAMSCSLTTVAQQARTISPNDFIKAVYTDNFYQIKAGNLALKKAHDGGVKSFGSQMVADYTQLNEQLKKLFPKDKYRLSNADSTDVVIGKLLATNSGADFDGYYISTIKIRDQHMADLYKTASTELSDLQLKEYALKNLEIIQDHSSSITALAKQINVKVP